MSITGSFCLPLLQVNAAFVKNTSERGGSLHSVFRLCFLVCLFAGFLMGCSGAPFAALEDRAGRLRLSRSPATMSQAKCQFIEFDCEFGESQQNTSISVRSCASLESVEVYPVRHSNYTVTRSGTGKFILESQHLLANTDKAIVCMNVKMTMLFISRVRGVCSATPGQCPFTPSVPPAHPTSTTAGSTTSFPTALIPAVRPDVYVRYRGILIGIPSFLAVLAITSAIIMKVVFSRRRDRHEQRRRRLREQVEQRPPRGSADLHEGNGVVPEDRREVVHNAIQRAGEAQGGWRAAPALDEGEVAGNAHPLLDTNIRLEAIPPQDVNVVGISPMQDRQFSIALSRHSLTFSNHSAEASYDGRNTAMAVSVAQASSQQELQHNEAGLMTPLHDGEMEDYSQDMHINEEGSSLPLRSYPIPANTPDRGSPYSARSLHRGMCPQRRSSWSGSRVFRT